MKKDVRWWSSFRSGTLWYPFHVSVTVFYDPLGTVLACLAGVLVIHSSLLQNLRGWRSTVRLTEPSGFLTHTIRWHHSDGTSTRSITPRATSRSRSAYTCSCQWSGIGYFARDGVFDQVDFHRRPVHLGQGLMGALIECGCSLSVQKPGLNFLDVRHGRA